MTSMARSQKVTIGGKGMTALSLDTQGLHKVVGEYITATAQPVEQIVREVISRWAVDREEVIATVWDLIEDDELLYDASARVRRP
jgi:hypothetical protein